MFLNQRSRRIAALVVTVFLLAVLPAAAGGHGKSQTTQVAKQADRVWEGLFARVLAWLVNPWSGGREIAMSDTSSQIDPLGQH